MNYTRKKQRTVIHTLEINAAVGCLKFDIRLPDGVKKIRTITVTTNA